MFAKFEVDALKIATDIALVESLKLSRKFT